MKLERAGGTRVAGDPARGARGLLLMPVEVASVAITVLAPGHWPEVARVYTEGIATGNATFETEVPSWDDWDATHLAEHRFVALRDESLVGWVAAGPVSDRCVYAGVVEHSVYVAARERRRGIGAMLLERLVASTRPQKANDRRATKARRK